MLKLSFFILVMIFLHTLFKYLIDEKEQREKSVTKNITNELTNQKEKEIYMGSLILKRIEKKRE